MRKLLFGFLIFYFTQFKTKIMKNSNLSMIIGIVFFIIFASDYIYDKDIYTFSWLLLSIISFLHYIKNIIKENL